MPRCIQCGAEISSETNNCPFCQAPISGTKSTNLLDAPKRTTTCIQCGTEVPDGSRFCSNCGRPLTISVTEVLNSTIRMLGKHPVIFLPYLVELIFSSLVSYWIVTPLLTRLPSVSPSLNLGFLLISLSRQFTLSTILALTVNPLIYGMYPHMVGDAIRGQRIDLTRSFRGAVRKFPPLCLSAGVISLAVGIGSVLGGLPGMILQTWYYYTSPAIILEDLGPRQGMSASKAFGRRRKWKTFILILMSSIPLLPEFIVGRILQISFPIAPLVYYPLELVSGAVYLVVASYVYITYAKPSQEM
jgi:hypothetical protein